MRKIVKVRVPVTVEVNVERWNREYRAEDSEQVIRGCVYRQVSGAVIDAYQHLESEPEPVVALRIG